MQKGKEAGRSAPVKLMSGVLLGAAIAFLLCVGILLAAAVGISAGILGEGTAYQVTLLACLLSVTAGGLFAVRRHRSVLTGAATGVVFYLCLLTVGLALYEISPLERGNLGILGACLVGGALAGLLGGRAPKRRRYGGDGAGRR
jgi:putative membrane protein (TIGR04086 family)